MASADKHAVLARVQVLEAIISELPECQTRTQLLAELTTLRIELRGVGIQ